MDEQSIEERIAGLERQVRLLRSQTRQHTGAESPARHAPAASPRPYNRAADTSQRAHHDLPTSLFPTGGLSQADQVDLLQAFMLGAA